MPIGADHLVAVVSMVHPFAGRPSVGVEQAACCAGVGLGPARMRLIARNDVWFCDVEPRFRLPDLQMSFRVTDSSPVLVAFLAVVRQNCPDVGSRLDAALARHPAATERQPSPGAS